MKKLIWFGVSFLVVLLDQLTKYWALSALYFFQPKAILPFLNMTLAYNTGAAFSFLSNAGHWHQLFFVGFSSIMVIVLIFWILKIKKETWHQALGLSLILGGAIGNLIDRIHLGFVVDFIQLYYKTYHFPVFNFADTSICIGAFILFLSFWKASAEKKQHA